MHFLSCLNPKKLERVLDGVTDQQSLLVIAVKLHRGREGSRVWEHWREFLRRLRFCVLDEAHTYSGVLGCHTANLMRRYLHETQCAALRLERLWSR